MAVGEKLKVAKGGLARVYRGGITDVYHFQYNPTVIERRMAVDWVISDTPGQYLPAATFAKFDAETIELELYINGRGADNTSRSPADFVDDHIKQIVALASPADDFSVDLPQFVAPPFIKLVLGRSVLNVVITDIDRNELRFDREYRPTEVRFRVQFTHVSRGIRDDVRHLDTIRTGALSGRLLS